MIFYDFSCHLLRLILELEKARKLKYYWPTFLVGKEKRYNIFWTVYWGLALILLLTYILTNKTILLSMNISTEVITFIALFVNTVALLIVIFQTYLAKKTFYNDRQSVNRFKIQRQLEVLPKFTWVIEVQVALEYWSKDLEETHRKLKEAVEIKDQMMLRKLSKSHIRQAKDLALSNFLYDNMPPWLREIWMSGAKYYYNAIASRKLLWKEEGGPNYSLAKIIKEECEESKDSIDILLGYTKDMVPRVILNTPAKLSDEDFLRND